MAQIKNPPIKRLSFSLAAMVGFSLLLLIARYLESDSSRYLFLIWNLVLAAIAPLLAWYLVVRVRSKGWIAWPQIGISVLWLVFLPNSFYIVTDFIHLNRTYEVSVLYDAVLIMMFALCGMVFGYMSVYMVHKELLRRVSSINAWSIIAGIVLLVSFAIYLGRYSRWNTWDIILRPAGLLFDVSDRIVNPLSHTQTYVTTTIFFGLIMTTYWVIWEFSRYLSSTRS